MRPLMGARQEAFYRIATLGMETKKLFTVHTVLYSQFEERSIGNRKELSNFRNGCFSHVYLNIVAAASFHRCYMQLWSVWNEYSSHDGPEYPYMQMFFHIPCISRLSRLNYASVLCASQGLTLQLRCRHTLCKETSWYSSESSVYGCLLVLHLMLKNHMLDIWYPWSWSELVLYAVLNYYYWSLFHIHYIFYLLFLCECS